MTDPVLAQIITDIARNDALRNVAAARAALERAMQDVTRYEQRIDEANSASDLGAMADNINWLIHHLTSNVLGNVRIDMLAKSAADLRVAAARAAA